MFCVVVCTVANALIFLITSRMLPVRMRVELNTPLVMVIVGMGPATAHVLATLLL